MSSNATSRARDELDGLDANSLSGNPANNPPHDDSEAPEQHPRAACGEPDGCGRLLAMEMPSFSEYLSNLDMSALTQLLTARPDVLVEPVPRGFTQLAARLNGVDSLSRALQTLNRDAVTVGQAVAVLGDSATVPAVARLLDTSAEAVRECLDDLCSLGLAWTGGEGVCLPDRLREHWVMEVGTGRPAAEMAQSVLVEDLRVAATALGVAIDGLRKPELAAAVCEAMADPRPLAATIAGLPAHARTRLDELRHEHFEIMFGYVEPGRKEVNDLLAKAGLVLRPNRRPEVPREVAIAAWLVDDEPRLTGRPNVPQAELDAPAVRRASQAAAREAVRAVSTLLDAARTKPLAALKKGGVGARERTRLAKLLSIAADELVLWIDLAHAAGLLAEVDTGYAPTDLYPDWRAADLATQWATLVIAWRAIEYSPLNRELDGGKEHPPPLPLMSAGGMIRRALLAATGVDGSVRAAGEAIDWFCPLHGYPAEQRDEKVRTAVREAELLGVIAGDRHSDLGAHLLSSVGVEELAALCGDLLRDTRCEVLLGSDLTAVVSGHPSAAVSTLLAGAAVPETRGSAEVWRFSPQSVRHALDVGWTVEGLLAELAAVSSRAVPQPLEYLVRDAARRHGAVRVRGMRSCVVADEALIAEIANTRSLAGLGFGRIAPTVLSSACEVDQVLARLRAAGLSPVAEDSSGTVIVETREEHQAEPGVARPSTRTAAELAKQLSDAPDDVGGSPTIALLTTLSSSLDAAESMLLAEAIDQHNDVLITYVDKRGARTVRQIQPYVILGDRIEAWCYLRESDREFLIANIENVFPAV